MTVALDQAPQVHCPATVFDRSQQTKTRTLAISFSPGDHAIVVRDDSDRLNLGLIVRIERYVGLHRWEVYDDVKRAWTGRYHDLPSWHVTAISQRGISYDAGGDLYLKESGVMPGRYLQRLPT